MKNPLIFLTIILLTSCAKPNYVDGLSDKIETLSAQCGLIFSVEDLCLQTKWIEKPSESSFGSMELTFTDKNDASRFIDPILTPEIILWMSSMGHGSSPVTLERVDVGRYKASEIFFIMSGPWDIRYQLKRGNDVIEEQIQQITI